MSFIDCYNHELCGTIAGLPLYRPLEEIRSVSEFCATSQDLVLGGGSGEHPAAVASILRCVGEFLICYEIEGSADDMYVDGFPTVEYLLGNQETMFEGVKHITAERFHEIADGLRERSLDPNSGINFEPAIDFLQWSGDVWYNFITRAKNPNGWARAYDPSETSIESWLAATIGEYALVSMPELVAGLVHGDEADEIRLLSKLVGAVPIFTGVAAFPAGYEHVGGRKSSLGDGNVRH